MNSDFSHDMYYENAPGRSPGVNRLQSQTLHRQPSRQFDAYGQLGSHMSTGLYVNPPTSSTPTIDENGPRFDAPRYNDRLNATMHGHFGGGSGMGGGGGGGGGYDMTGLAGWNASAFSQSNTLAPVGGATTARLKPNVRGRAGLPPAWLDQPQPIPPVPPFPTLGNPSLVPSPIRGDVLSPDLDDELIPTAIVIKNIPFAVKKEQLVQLMTDLRLPLPYAFNYHFDNGVFRGLAFANFTTADETAAVIETMNHFELQGRKLRVEYKKMLPLAERERIEREKRERRGQLEEQHRPLPSMNNQPSMSSLSSHMPTSTPSPLSARGPKLDYDLNDPQVLQFYSQLLLFKEDALRDTMSFPSTLTPQQRRIVHTLAHQMGLMHLSKGTGEQRQVHILRTHEIPNLSPPMSQLSAQDSQRRALSRAATTDFSDVRGSDMYGAGAGPGAGAGALGRQSSGFLGFLESPGGGGGNSGGLSAGGIGGGGGTSGVGVGGVGGLLAGQNLRAAKSFADLRSYTPSPVPSTASFPATLSTNFSRFNDPSLAQQGGYGPGPSSMSQGHSHTLNSAGAASSNAGSLSAGAVGSGREDDGRSMPSLVNGLSNVTIGPGFGPGSAGSPRGLRGVMSWDRDHWERDRDGSFFSANSNNSNNAGNDVGGLNSAGGNNAGGAGGSNNPGPIGGHRSMSMHFDEHSHQGQSQSQSQSQSQPQLLSLHPSFASSQQLQPQHHHSFTSLQQQQHSQSSGSGSSSNSTNNSQARLPGERTLGHQSSMPLRQARGPPGILTGPERGSLTGSSSSSTLKTSASTLSNGNNATTPTGISSGFASGRTSGLGVVGAGLGGGSGSGAGTGTGIGMSSGLRGTGAGSESRSDEVGSSSPQQNSQEQQHEQNQQKAVEIVVE